MGKSRRNGVPIADVIERYDTLAESDFRRRRTFYERLFAEGDLLSGAEQGPVTYLQPRVALYQLPPAPRPGVPVPGPVSAEDTIGEAAR
jgi:hypothetical protein